MRQRWPEAGGAEAGGAEAGGAEAGGAEAGGAGLVVVDDGVGGVVVGSMGGRVLDSVMRRMHGGVRRRLSGREDDRAHGDAGERSALGGGLGWPQPWQRPVHDGRQRAALLAAADAGVQQYTER
jgi:hypothetical protein